MMCCHISMTEQEYSDRGDIVIDSSDHRFVFSLVTAFIQLLEYVIPTAPAATAAPPKSPRLTHYPTANTLSNHRRVGHTA